MLLQKLEENMITKKQTKRKFLKESKCGPDHLQMACDYQWHESILDSVIRLQKTSKDPLANPHTVSNGPLSDLVCTFYQMRVKNLNSTLFTAAYLIPNNT